MATDLDTATPMEQATFLLLRNLIKYLVIEGPMEVERMESVLRGTVMAAEAGGHDEAAAILERLKSDLMR